MIANVNIEFIQQPTNGMTFSYTINKNGTPITYDSGSQSVEKRFTGVTTSISRGRITQSDFDFDLDPTFHPVGAGYQGGDVYDIAIGLSGSIFVAGDFTTYDGVSSMKIDKISATGSPKTFLSSLGANVRTLAYDPNDGVNDKLYAGGDFTQTGPGGTYTRIIRFFAATGSVDTSFNQGTGFNATVNKILFQPSDSKIVVGGAFTQYNGTNKNRIVRINNNGTLDTSFTNNIGTGFNNGVREIIQDSNGKYMIGGDFTSFNGSSATRYQYMVRLNPNGTLDSSFNSTSTGFPLGSSIRTIIQDPTTLDYYIGGSFTSFNNYARTNIVKCDVYGQIDTSWNLTLNGGVWDIQMDSDGNIVVVGAFTLVNGASHIRAVKIDTSGTILSDGTNSFNNTVQVVKETATDKYVFAGSFTSISSVLASQYDITIGATMLGTRTNTYNNLITYDTNPVLSYAIDGNFIRVSYEYDPEVNLTVTNIVDQPGYVEITTDITPIEDIVQNIVVNQETPYWIEYSSSDPYDYVYVELFIYTGAITNAPIEPTHNFTKYKRSSDETNIAMDISMFVSSLLNPLLTSNWFDSSGTTLNNFNEFIWVKYRMIPFSILLPDPVGPRQDGIFLASKGWSFYEEGANVRPGLTYSDVSNNTLTIGQQAWLAELQLPYEDGLTTDNCLLRTNLTYTMDRYCEALYKPYQIVFLNKNGVFEGFNFPKRSDIKIKYEQKDFNRLSRNPQSYDTTRHQRGINYRESQKQITLNTDLLEQGEVNALVHLMESKLHYLIDLEQNIFPVILMTKDLDVKQDENEQGDIQYDILFEFANDVKNTIR